MGRIGTAVARRAKGFNMPIIYHNRSRNEEAEKELGAKYVSFDELLTEADYVVSLVPLSEETKRIFNKDAFAKMKKSAIFIKDRKSTRLNSSHVAISYAVFCLKKKTTHK